MYFSSSRWKRSKDKPGFIRTSNCLEFFIPEAGSVDTLRGQHFIHWLITTLPSLPPSSPSTCCFVLSCFVSSLALTFQQTRYFTYLAGFTSYSARALALMGEICDFLHRCVHTGAWYVQGVQKLLLNDLVNSVMFAHRVHTRLSDSLYGRCGDQVRAQSLLGWQLDK